MMRALRKTSLLGPLSVLFAALGTLLCPFGLAPATPTAQAGGLSSATSSATGAATASGSLVREALQPVSVEELVGGEGLSAARLARRDSPEAVAARDASRDKYGRLGAEQVRAVAAGAFPGLIAATAGGVPALPRGQRIVSYLTDRSARVSTPAGPRLIESLAPIATRASGVRRAPIDLRLSAEGGGFRPVRSPVHVNVPRELAQGVALSGVDVSLTPLKPSGRPLEASAGALEGAGVLWTAARPVTSGGGDQATFVKASPRGFDLTSILLSQRSSRALYFRVGMPAGASLVRADDDSISVRDHGATLAVIEPVSAEDAEGTSVPVAETLHGRTIELSVDLAGDYLYPISVDPEVNDGQLGKTAAGKRSNWAFSTNSTHFSSSESPERLEAKATGGYGANEWGFWGYQTKGVSHVYEVKTETSAHNAGAKVESFLEFEEPGGAQETKKILSSPFENSEYERKAATLCAANASKIEECLPGAGKPNNAVHFQQSTTGASGTGFSDAITQGIVSIAEPAGTHSTASFNTTSSSLEFETESEGKKVKVIRANALYGPGSWLTRSSGAVAPIAKDTGIGVAATKLEYESSAGTWTSLFEHGYLEHENACQGVQCYASHEEVATLPASLPDGEDRLRYKAEEAMTGTQSLSTEGLATVKVDTTPPRRILLEGLPYGNELSERSYTLKVRATDGEGAAVASSGVKSLALFVSGHERTEVGKQLGCTVAKGECTATAEWTINGAELGAGHHAIVIVATDNAGNQTHLEETITIRHSTPVALGPGTVDLQSGDFALSAGDVSLGSGLTVARNYSSRAPEAGDVGPLGPQWSLNGGNAQSLVELVDGAMMLTDSNGRQVLFASLGAGAFESPPGDSNLKLTLEESKTKQKLAYYLEDPAAHTKTKFTLPANGSQWVPNRTEGAVGTDTMTYGYQAFPLTTEYPVAAETAPYHIVTGPDGNLWFQPWNGSYIGRVTPAGVVKEFSLGGRFAREMIVGSDGNLWFPAGINSSTKGIDKMTTSGKITEYSVPDGEPYHIAQGPEGNIWFTGAKHVVGKMTPAGQVTEYTVETPSPNAEPDSITAGPDGNMWFTEADSQNYSAIWRITPSGATTGFTISGSTSGPESIVTGPDGNLWFIEKTRNKIAKMTTSGVFTEYSVPAVPTALTVGPDRNLWFTQPTNNKIGKITTSGAIAEYTLGSSPYGIAAGPDGKIWYTSYATSKIGTTTTTERITEPTETLAPVQAGVTCAPELKAGCRRLWYYYAPTTTATGESPSEWGRYQSRLWKVYLEAFNPVSKTLQMTAVAEYSYDSRGELRAEWDPRISPALKTTYGYDEQGHLTALSAPGRQPWIFTYGTGSGDSGTGRLLKETRPPAGTALWNGEAVVATTKPTFRGSAKVGERTVATAGGWSGSPLAYSFQWERCQAAEEACVPILGATNKGYVPQSADAGRYLAIAVTATNAGGSATQTSYMGEPVSEGDFKAPHEIIEYSLAAGSSPFGITAGSDGNIWFTESGSGKVGKITKTGATQEYATGTSEPEGITAGSQGNTSLWFVQHSGRTLGEITTSGASTEYQVKQSTPRDVGVAAGSEGDLWLTESEPGYIAKMTTAGVTAGEYALPAGSKPYGITLGTAGRLWFTDYGTSKIGKITAEGAITEYALPTGSNPYAIVYGNGNAWFTDYGTSKIGKINAEGAITEYALPSGSEPRGIAFGTDGRLWVAESGTSKLAAVTSEGVVTQYALPAGSVPYGVARGSEGNIWFTDFGTNKIGKIDSNNVEEEPAPEPGTTIDYNAPLSGAGLPNMTSGEVAKWGQSDQPVEGTAITPPDEPQGWPASSYKRATVYYLDGKGRQVNVASPSSSPNGSVSTTEYNEFNDPIRTLTPQNRQASLEAGAGSVAKSKVLDTQSTFNGEGAKEGEVPEQGTRLIESVGPQHKVTYVAGHEQKESLARLHSKYFYDEGAPGGETYDLQTKVTTLAQLSNEEEVEVRTSKTSYSGQSNLGWKLRASTSTTSYGPEEVVLSKNAAEYNPTTGQVTETRGTSAETTLTYAKKFGETGSEAGKLKAPWGTVVNSEGQVLVVDSANNRIEKFSSEGAYVSAFGTAGSGNGQLKEPQGIALDSVGNVWVADSGNNRVEEFSSAGAFVKTVGSLGSESGKLKAPSDLAFDPKGNLWVSDSGNSRVEKFNKEGAYVSEFGSAGSEPGKLKEPKGIAIDAGEHVWVADTANNRVEEFSGSGSLLKRFGTSGSGEGQLNTPIDLRIDAQGNIWTADSHNNRAEAFSPSGAYVTQIGYAGTAAGQLTEPKGIAFDATGNEWVADSANNRLEQFSKGPNAHDQKTIYYSAEANKEGFAACGSRPEWAGLICETLPAKQPELMGLPPLPVTTYAAYNMYDEPETITESFGTSTRTKKETYDPAGRRSTSETTASSGKALPQVSFTYNPEQGVLEKETAEGKSLSSEYNKLGELTKYTDADGNTAKYTYSSPENDNLLSEASDSSAAGTSKQSYEYDPTTKLRTKLIDSAAGTVTATYDLEGKLASESYPYGMCANYTYNSIEQATSVQYIKSSNCSQTEAGTYYQDSDSSSIRGEMLRQESTLANDTYAYDPAGRLTETQETPAGEGCTVRAYSYDEESNRASSTTRAPGTGGVCQSEGGTTESHNYDESNRLADSGLVYDAYGNVTKLPAADAEGHELTSSYYVDNAVATQTQSGVTNEYKLDPEGRTRELVSGATKTVEHYDGAGEAVAWSESSEKWVRNIAGIDGTLLATQTNGATPVLQLHDLQGNVIGTIGDKAGESKLLSSYNSTEFGVPRGGKTPPKFAYLGAVGVESSLASGVITYGATSYVPQTGRALQSEAVSTPGLSGGSGAGAPYTMQEEPWNMQGAAREAAEAPGLEAAREQAALQAAATAISSAQIIDPSETMNRKRARALGEEFLSLRTAAEVASLLDIPGDIIELIGGAVGAELGLNDAFSWLNRAGEKLIKCSENNRVNGLDQPLNICSLTYAEIRVEVFGDTVAQFVDFAIDPKVSECFESVLGGSVCTAEVHVPAPPAQA
jgi:streptogramin lyase